MKLKEEMQSGEREKALDLPPFAFIQVHQDTVLPKDRDPAKTLLRPFDCGLQMGDGKGILCNTRSPIHSLSPNTHPASV